MRRLIIVRPRCSIIRHEAQERVWKTARTWTCKTARSSKDRFNHFLNCGRTSRIGCSGKKLHMRKAYIGALVILGIGIIGAILFVAVNGPVGRVPVGMAAQE